MSEAPDTVGAELARLEQAGVSELRASWRRLHGTDPPRLSRDLLVRALAFRVQEQAHGGLSRASLRRLGGFDAEDGAAPRERTASVRPGTRLVREWHGRTHVVTATPTGFDYAGASYRSLTEIAKLITGAHWSGPRFFGLTGRRARGGPGDG